MKRFLLFEGDHYYPIGGWDDFSGDFDTKIEALNALPAWMAREAAPLECRKCHTDLSQSRWYGDATDPVLCLACARKTNEAAKSDYEWYQIVDTEKMKVVEHSP